MKKSASLFSLLLITVPATLALAHSGATGIVKERMDMFKKNQGNLKAIKSHIGSEDYESIVKLADEIRDWAVKMPEYFPEGSNEKPSEAPLSGQTLTVKNAAMKNEAAAKLIAAAKAEDQKAVADGFKAGSIMQKLSSVIQTGLDPCRFSLYTDLRRFVDCVVTSFAGLLN